LLEFLLWQINLPVKKKMAKKIAMNDFEVILERIRQETGLKSMRQLADIIGVKHQTISAAKKKNEFSAGWAYIVAKEYAILTEWIMTGEGPKRIYGEDKRLEILSEFEEWISEEIRKEPKKKIWFKIQIQESFPGFKAWKEEKEEKSSFKAGDPIKKVA
jgi:DNA-binding transcriptional regulator YhcF (GntR family)